MRVFRSRSPLPKFLLAGCVAVLLLALAGCTGAERLAGERSGWNTLYSTGDRVYVTTKQGQVQLLTDNGFDGYVPGWSFPPNGSTIEIGGAYSPPLVQGRLVYISSLDGYLYALDTEDGSVTDRGWRRPEGQASGLQPLVSGPAYDPVNRLILVTSEDGHLYGYEAETGTQIWDAFETGDRIWSTPAVDNAVAYFGSHDHRIYAVRTADGQELWSFETGGVVAGKPLIVDGKVIAGSFDRKLYALDATDGSVVWEFEGENWFWAGAITDGRTIYAPNMDGKVYALNTEGLLLWSHDMGAAIVSQPALVPLGLVVANKDGKISLLEVGLGAQGVSRELSVFVLNDADIRAPLAVSGDSVYVGAQDDSVRRIQVKGGGQQEMWCWKPENTPC